MLDYLALARTKQVRPDTLGYSGPIEAHLAFRGHCRGRNYWRRDGSFGEDHPANV